MSDVRYDENVINEYAEDDFREFETSIGVMNVELYYTITERVNLYCFCLLRSGECHFIHIASVCFNWYLVVPLSKISKLFELKFFLHFLNLLICLKTCDV